MYNDARFTCSKSLFMVFRKWSEGFWRVGHGKPLELKNCIQFNGKNINTFDTLLPKITKILTLSLNYLFSCQFSTIMCFSK